MAETIFFCSAVCFFSKHHKNKSNSFGSIAHAVIVYNTKPRNHTQFTLSNWQPSKQFIKTKGEKKMAVDDVRCWSWCHVACSSNNVPLSIVPTYSTDTREIRTNKKCYFIKVHRLVSKWFVLQLNAPSALTAWTSKCLSATWQNWRG